MRPAISLNWHTGLDYVFGFALLICPALFGFVDVLSARNTFYALGGGLILYSLLSNYRYSVAKWIPLGVHIGMDFTLGVVILLAPRLFGYRDFLTSGQIALHSVLGIAFLAQVAATRPRSEQERIEMIAEASRPSRAA